MESLAYLWRDGEIYIQNGDYYSFGAEDFLPILNSPTILQCRVLCMFNAHFAFKDYKILYAVKLLELGYTLNEEDDPNYWQQFLEQPGVKPIVALLDPCRENVVNLLDRLSKAFSSAILPNAFKIVFSELEVQLTEFRETNNTSGEILELKKGLPVDYYGKDVEKDYHNYTLERTNI
ncbi:hypothetical protein Ddc_05207 [Ditylenchus destructor]|nr:hypothetical protein Ddc_05207 [Ditylenchus destructor]